MSLDTLLSWEECNNARPPSEAEVTVTLLDIISFNVHAQRNLWKVSLNVLQIVHKTVNRGLKFILS